MLSIFLLPGVFEMPRYFNTHPTTKCFTKVDMLCRLARKSRMSRADLTAPPFCPREAWGPDMS